MKFTSHLLFLHLLSLIGVVMLCLNPIYGQIKQATALGVPFVHSYDKEAYKAGTQNWAISQDVNGVIYVANNDGLLVNNGSDWRTYYLPNRTLARSLAVSKDRKVYVGGQNEFGYFELQNNGDYTFTSLAGRFEDEYRDFEDVWDIQIFGEAVFFRSSGRIYELGADDSSVYQEKKIKSLFKSDDKLFAQDQDGFLIYNTGSGWNALEVGPGINRIAMKGIQKYDRSTQLVLSQNNGLFLMSNSSLKAFPSSINDLLKDVKGLSLARISEDNYAIGTAVSGVIIINREGSFVSRIGREEGLLSNKAQALYVDEAFNLWVGMNKGLSLIYTNSPFTRISPDKAHEGIGYGAHVFKDHLYLATDNGLYVRNLAASLSLENFNLYEMIDGTDGQTWGLNEVLGKLFLSHNKGAFEVDLTTAEAITEGTGYWLFQEDDYHENKLIIGGYEGLSYATSIDGALKNIRKQEGLVESSRFIVQGKNGDMWMAHPYRGIYKIDRKNKRIQKFGKSDGLPSDLHNHVFKVNDEIVFCGETGIFVFDEEKQRFTNYQELAVHFDKEEKIRRLYNSPNGDLWFITSKEVGLLQIRNKGLELEINKQVFPFLKSQMNDGFEDIYIHNGDEVFISTTKGFIHYDRNRSISAQSPHTLMLSSTSRGRLSNELIYYNMSNEIDQTELELPVGFSSVSFDFNVVNFSLDKLFMYRWKLDGFDADWSEWSDQTNKEYTNLGHGSYTFLLEAKSQTSEALKLHLPIDIDTAWYATGLAKFCFFLLAGFVALYLVRKSRKEKAALETQVETTVKESEEEIKRLENEKIKNQLEHKKRELISTTMNLVQKNETFIDLKKNLQEIKKISSDNLVKSRINSTIKLISQEETNTNNWEQFMFHFNELNGDFVERLQSKFEGLTPKDIKMCTYLRMNLTTKEISKLLNVTIRSVEASRYRLRKKLELHAQDNLNDFFMRF